MSQLQKCIQFPSSVLTLLVGRQEGHLACKNVGCCFVGSQCFFSLKYRFSFSFGYNFRGIFVLVFDILFLTFLYVNVVRLMTTLSK